MYILEGRTIMKSLPYYWNNPLADKFEVTIESIIEEDNHFYVEIQESVVKVAGGGQAGDRGILIIDDCEIPFIDTIVHDEHVVLVTEIRPKKGGKSSIKIDMDWRRNMMSNHTSEHIFVGSLKKKYPELELGRIWIDGLHGTITLAGKNLTTKDIFEAESNVEDVIHKCIDVTTEIVKADMVDESVRAREGVTSKHDTIRLVKIGNYDSSACSGVHVTNTHEIGIFKIIDIKMEGNETHLEFISGKQAIDVLCRVYNTVLERKYGYPFEMDQLGAILDKAKTLQISFDQSIEKILQLLKTGPEKEKIGDVVFWHEYLPGFDSSSIRYLMKELDFESPSVILFFAPGKKSNLSFWTNGMPNDASQYIAEIVEKLGGRGGGSRDAYTGGFVDIANPEDIFESIVQDIRRRLE